MLHVRRIERPEEFDCLRKEWNALLDPEEPRAVFLRHEWVRAWFEAYGGGRAPHLLVATRGGELQGVLPACASADRFAGLNLRRLDIMANGHSPRADLVARSGSLDGVVAAFRDFLLGDDARWDVAACREVEAGSGLTRLAAGFPDALRIVEPQRRAPYILLDGDWESFRGARSRNFQKMLRNNRNRIARHGHAEIELLESADALLAALPDTIAIGDRSWQGEAGSAVGSDAPNRAFYSGLVRELSPLGLLRLWFLRLDGRRVAFELHAVHAGTEFGLKTGFDLEFEALGAGTYLDQHIVERLFAEGRVREYDLLGDTDPYKLRWTERTRDYVRITLFGRRANARLLSLWNLKLKPALKQARALGRSAGLLGLAAAFEIGPWLLGSGISWAGGA